MLVNRLLLSWSFGGWLGVIRRRLAPPSCVLVGTLTQFAAAEAFPLELVVMAIEYMDCMDDGLELMQSLQCQAVLKQQLFELVTANCSR